MPARPAPTRPLPAFLVALCLAAVLGACSEDASAGPPPAPLLLSGPTTNVVAAIPAGWHQVINSSSPLIPEMVTPTDCMGSDEVSCAAGLARIATTTAATPADAAHDVVAAVVGPGGPGSTASDGPERVGQRDGYRQRFTFTNARGPQQAQVAVVASGPTTPDPQGRLEYSVVLAWVQVAPGGPAPRTLDQIVDSVLVHGGQSPQR